MHQRPINVWNVNMVIARTFVHLGIPSLKERSFAIIFLSTNYFGVFKYGHIAQRVGLSWNSYHYIQQLFYVLLFLFSMLGYSLTIINKITSGTFNFINDVPCSLIPCFCIVSCYHRRRILSSCIWSLLAHASSLRINIFVNIVPVHAIVQLVFHSFHHWLLYTNTLWVDWGRTITTKNECNQFLGKLMSAMELDVHLVIVDKNWVSYIPNLFFLYLPCLWKHQHVKSKTMHVASLLHCITSLVGLGMA
jgi:hypothetical protein